MPKYLVWNDFQGRESALTESALSPEDAAEEWAEDMCIEPGEGSVVVCVAELPHLRPVYRVEIWARTAYYSNILDEDGEETPEDDDAPPPRCELTPDLFVGRGNES